MRPVTFTAEEWRAHLELDAQLREQNRVQRELIARLEVKVDLLQGRPPPTPDWVKPNVPARPEEQRKKRGAVEGHKAHHRPAPPRIDETREVRLEQCARCGGGLGEPFAIDERVVEAIVPGHVRVTKYRIGRYRCGHGRRVRRARLAPDVAPPRSRFD